MLPVFLVLAGMVAACNLLLMGAALLVYRRRSSSPTPPEAPVMTDAPRYFVSKVTGFIYHGAVIVAVQTADPSDFMGPYTDYAAAMAAAEHRETLPSSLAWFYTPADLEAAPIVADRAYADAPHLSGPYKTYDAADKARQSALDARARADANAKEAVSYANNFMTVKQAPAPTPTADLGDILGPEFGRREMAPTVPGLSDADAAVLAEVGAERARQDAKWGSQDHNPADWLMILAEEVGEANKAALENAFPQCGPGTLADYRRELIEVAAVAVAAVKNLDERGRRLSPEPDYGNNFMTVKQAPAPAADSAAYFLSGLAERMRTGEAEPVSWRVEYAAEPVGLSGDPIRTGAASLFLTFVEPLEAARFREAVAQCKPVDGITVDPATFEKLRLRAQAKAGPEDFAYCGYCDHLETSLGGGILHAPDCPGPELERLAALDRQG